MNKEEAIYAIELLGTQLSKNIQLMDEGNGFSKEEIKKFKNNIIEREIEQCKQYYTQYLTIEEIREHLIIGIRKILSQKKSDNEIEL